MLLAGPDNDFEPLVGRWPDRCMPGSQRLDVNRWEGDHQAQPPSG